MRKFNLMKTFLAAITIIAVYAHPAQASGDPDRLDDYLGTEWYGIYLQGGKIGYAAATLERTNYPVDGWRVSMDMTMIISMLGKTDTMTTSDVRIFESPGGEMYSSTALVSGATGDMSVKGSKEADEYVIKTDIGGQITTRSFSYPLDYIDSLFYLKTEVSSGNLSLGDSMFVANFEPTPPLTGTVHQAVKITSKDVYIFNGVPTDVYTAEWTLVEMGLQGRTIMDMSGRELEVTMGGGMLMKLETESMAKSLDIEFDFLTDNLIHPQGTIDDPQALSSLKLRITGIGEEDVLRFKGQAVTKDQSGALRVDIERQSEPEKIVGLPIRSSRLQPFLDAGPYIQSDDEEIINLARRIVGDETNSLRAAQLINDWVYVNIDKQFTPAFSNALQTLHSLQGDCGEHTALAVALMRAAGIPARAVAGLVYAPAVDGFGYHAWVEAYVGDWVMMDPSWGEDFVNPTHIALTRGDLMDQVRIIYRVLGKMDIEVLEAR